jgi:rhodanese-related sulfurtransferase
MEDPMKRCRLYTVTSLATLAGLIMLSGCQSAPQAKPEAPAVQQQVISKAKGKIKTIVAKNKTISLTVEGLGLVVIKYDEATKLANAPSFKDLHPDEFINVEYRTEGAEKVATLISKAVIELPAGATLMKLEEAYALVQKGPKAGNFVLIDSRPPSRYHEGHIPGAVSIPFADMEKTDKEGKADARLPEDKGRMLIFYCGGITCPLSPKAATLALKQGYTNVRVFHEGEPVWSKADHPLESSPKQIKEGNILLIDLRSPAQFAAGHIERAVNLPLADLSSKYSEATFPEYKGSLIVFTSDSMADMEAAVEQMKDWGFTRATIFSGGAERWKKAEIPVATGPKPAPAKLTYVRKLAPHEVSIADFMAAVNGSGTLIVDARSTSEFSAGHFRNAGNIPSEEMEKRFTEVPKDKPVFLYCSTGSRAEMAYDILKEKGFTNVKLVKANIEFEGDKYKITE